MDYVFSSLVLHHIKDTEGVFKQFNRVLRDSGYLIIVDINPDDGEFHAEFPDFNGHNGFRQPTLLALAAKAGFTKASSETFYHGVKIAGGKEISYSLFLLDAMK